MARRHDSPRVRPPLQSAPTLSARKRPPLTGASTSMPRPRSSATIRGAPSSASMRRLVRACSPLDHTASVLAPGCDATRKRRFRTDERPSSRGALTVQLAAPNRARSGSSADGEACARAPTSTKVVTRSARRTSERRVIARIAASIPRLGTRPDGRVRSTRSRPRTDRGPRACGAPSRPRGSPCRARGTSATARRRPGCPWRRAPRAAGPRRRRCDAPRSR